MTFLASSTSFPFSSPIACLAVAWAKAGVLCLLCLRTRNFSPRLPDIHRTVPLHPAFLFAMLSVEICTMTCDDGFVRRRPSVSHRLGNEGRNTSLYFRPNRQSKRVLGTRRELSYKCLLGGRSLRVSGIPMVWIGKTGIWMPLAKNTTCAAFSFRDHHRCSASCPECLGKPVQVPAFRPRWP